MNVREPKQILEEFLQIQDEYLQEEQSKRTLTDVSEIASCDLDERLALWQGDINYTENRCHCECRQQRPVRMLLSASWLH